MKKLLLLLFICLNTPAYGYADTKFGIDTTTKTFTAILSHTSGQPADMQNEDMRSRKVYFTTVVKQVLVNKANYRFSYSNVALDLLDYAIERFQPRRPNSTLKSILLISRSFIIQHRRTN